MYGGELEGVLQHSCTYQHHRDVGHKGRAGVHEDSDEDGDHGIRQDVHVDKRVAYKECRKEGEDDDKGIEHGDAARLVEIVFAVKAQIGREADHQDGDIENLSYQRQVVLPDILVAPFVLFFKRFQYAVGLVGNNLAAVNNLLARLNVASRFGYACFEILSGFVRADVVVDVVGKLAVVDADLSCGNLRGGSSG